MKIELHFAEFVQSNAERHLNLILAHLHQLGATRNIGGINPVRKNTIHDAHQPGVRVNGH